MVKITEIRVLNAARAAMQGGCAVLANHERGQRCCFWMIHYEAFSIRLFRFLSNSGAESLGQALKIVFSKYQI
jgi:hypothetical protein